jgi:L-lactate dehydrogenase complex protein LldG
LPDVIAAVLSERGKRRLAGPRGLPVSWLPPGFEFVQADRLSPLQIDAFDGIVSGCTAGIALTGSLVLQNAPAQGPRALSLVPDYHLCIVFAVQVVATVPEAFDRLAASSKLPTTFISGPSATADIEMTRIKGVHGPRFLDVILVA